ncbi:N-acetylmuramoyl-L-alanine amidase, partial [Bacillus toyonensis]
EAYVVWAEKDGWLNLGGDQWIKYDSSYVKFEKKSKGDSSIVGKRIVSKVNNLRFYDAPSWQDKDVAGTVDEGEEFISEGEIMVNGSPQFQVHNSKGEIYYITANEVYVFIK